MSVAFIFVAGLLGAIPPASAATAVEIPCKDTGATTSACKLFSAPCTAARNAVIAGIEASIQNKLVAIQQGKDVGLVAGTQDTAVPSCELAVNPPERFTNAAGVSCGNTARIKIGGGADFSNANGENTYRKGTWVSGLKCFWRTMKKDIEDLGVIQNIPASCQALADDVLSLTNQSSTAWTDLLARTGEAGTTQNFCSQKMILDFSTLSVPDTCRNNQQDQGDESVEQSVRNIQAACYLAAGRTALYAAIQNLAMCTLFKTTETSWYALFHATPNVFDAELALNYMPTMSSVVRGQIKSDCRKKLRARKCVRNSGRGTDYHAAHYWEFHRAFDIAKFPPSAPVSGACFRP